MELCSAKWDSVCAPSAGALQKDHPEQGCLGLSSFWWNSVLGDAILLQISATLLSCARIINKFYILYKLYLLVSYFWAAQEPLWQRFWANSLWVWTQDARLSILMHRPLLEKAAGSHTPKGSVEKKLKYSKKKPKNPPSFLMYWKRSSQLFPKDDCGIHGGASERCQGVWRVVPVNSSSIPGWELAAAALWLMESQQSQRYRNKSNRLRNAG